MKDSPAKLEGLVRSLNLIPYLSKHRSATPMEIARDLGYSHEEVMADLTRLTLTGVGNGPGELIDLVADWTGITVIDDQGLNQPLRLTPTEANALLLTLESLETMPGLIDHAAVNSAAAKLRAVTRGHDIADVQASPDPGPTAVIAEAIAQRCKLALTYYSASSDTTRTRTVSPVTLFHQSGETYLRAFEEGEPQAKSFRLDRVEAASLIDAASTAPVDSPHFDTSDPFGFAGRNRARLLIRKVATWLMDYWEIYLDAPRGDSSGDGSSGDDASATGVPDQWVGAEMPYGSNDWLVRFCLSQSDRVTLVEPTNLAEELTRRAKAGAEGLR